MLAAHRLNTILQIEWVHFKLSQPRPVSPPAEITATIEMRPIEFISEKGLIISHRLIFSEHVFV